MIFNIMKSLPSYLYEKLLVNKDIVSVADNTEEILKLACINLKWDEAKEYKQYEFNNVDFSKIVYDSIINFKGIAHGKLVRIGSTYIPKQYEKEIKGVCSLFNKYNLMYEFKIEDGGPNGIYNLIKYLEDNDIKFTDVFNNGWGVLEILNSEKISILGISIGIRGRMWVGIDQEDII